MTVVWPVLALLSLGHAPVVDSEDLRLTDVDKSWALYGRLHDTDDRWQVTFEAKKGQEIRIQLSASPAAAPSDLPRLAILGPGFPPLDETNATRFGATHGVMPAVELGNIAYEPFAPMAHQGLAQFDGRVPENGTYRIVVLDGIGPISLAIGQAERFTVAEWTLMPWTLMHVQTWWTGSVLWVVAPFVAGAALFAIRWGRTLPPDLATWLLLFAGAAAAGRTLEILVQMTYALTFSGPSAGAIATLLFFGVSLAISVALMRRAREPATPRQAGVCMALGLVALVTWTGLLITPVAAFAGGAMRLRK